MSTLAERLKAFWTSEGVPFRAGVPQSEIESFEAKHGVTLPEDLKEYFLGVDGMQPGSTDSILNQFLPLGHVVSIPEYFADSFRPADARAALPNCELCFVLVDCG